MKGRQESPQGDDVTRLPVTEPPTTITLARLPTMAELIARSGVPALRRRQGGGGGLISLPGIEVLCEGVEIDEERLAAYRRLCGFGAHATPVPPTYPETFFLGPMGEIALSSEFPVSPFGLIHVRQEIVQHAPLEAGAAYDLYAALAEGRRSSRGLEVDIRLEVRKGPATLWEGRTTLLSRSRETRRPQRRRRTPVQDAATHEAEVATIAVAEDTGRRYAEVSGDYNPHHLWRWTARPLGYRAPIAHGMWSLARALAELLSPDDPGESVEAVAKFKRPIFMPAMIRVLRVDRGDDRADETFEGGAPERFTVRDSRDGTLHLEGALRS